MPRRILGFSGLLSKLTGSKRWRANSDLYQGVSDTLESMTQLLSQPVTLANAQKMDQLEKSLKVKGQLYLSARKNPRTPKGKARYQMISEVMALKGIQEELRNPAKIAQYQAQGRTLLGVMSEVRIPPIVDITRKEKTVVGAGASQRIRFEHNGKTGFFSPESKANPEKSTAIQEFESKLTPQQVQLFQRPDIKPLIHNIKETIFEVEGQSDSQIMHFIGMDDLSNLKEEEIKDVVSFAKYVAKSETLKWVSESDAGIKVGEEISKRNVATSRMASLMGIGSKIAQTEYMTIIDGGKTIKGTYMEKAVGCDSRSSEGLRFMADRKLDLTSGRLQRDISNMQAFDMLCGQVDRHGGNFFYQISPVANAKGEYEVTGIQGIDNDMSFGVKKLTSRKQLPGISELTMIDEEMYESFKDLTDDKVKYTLGEMLAPDEIQSILSRRDEILAKVKSGSVRVVKENEWGALTLEDSKRTPYYTEVKRELSDPAGELQRKKEGICDDYYEKTERMKAYNLEHPLSTQPIPPKPDGYDEYLVEKLSTQYEKQMQDYEMTAKAAIKNGKPVPTPPEGYTQYVKQQREREAAKEEIEIIPDKPGKQPERHEVSIEKLEGKKQQITAISTTPNAPHVKPKEMGEQ